MLHQVKELPNDPDGPLRDVEWVHGLFLFPIVLGKMYLPPAKFGIFCVV